MKRSSVYLSCAVVVLALTLFTSLGRPAAHAQGRVETIEVDAKGKVTPFPHFWEKMFGSGRAVLSLREGYRNDLRAVKKITGFQYVRFHAVFHDEMGVYDEDAQGNPVYNFSYVDQVYDGLLENGVRPFVEVSFMPRKLAANPTQHAFWYKQYVAPPKDWQRWEDLVTAFAKHLVERYGADEVAQWYFEVWNEPNIDFWAGEPKEATYFKLYDLAAQAIKRVNPRLRIGGPATAQAAWADRFIRHCVENNVPFDFVSTHAYANDTSQDIFGTDEKIDRNTMFGRAVRKVYDQVKASARPNVPIIWSEYNASYMNEPQVTDTLFMGPWLANTIRQCDGMVDTLSYWTFSDVFEEQGVVKTPFYGGFGLLAAGSLPKPAFNAFKLLHHLGEQRIETSSNSALATRRADGKLAIAVWNLFLPEEAGQPKQITLQVKGAAANGQAVVYRLDAEHGSLLPAYEAMGRPRYPTKVQLEKLRKAAELPAPQTLPLHNGKLTLTLPAHGLALIEVR